MMLTYVPRARVCFVLINCPKIQQKPGDNNVNIVTPFEFRTIISSHYAHNHLHFELNFAP